MWMNAYYNGDIDPCDYDVTIMCDASATIGRTTPNRRSVVLDRPTMVSDCVNCLDDSPLESGPATSPRFLASINESLTTVASATQTTMNEVVVDSAESHGVPNDSDEEVSMESRLLCRAQNSPLPSPTSQSQGDECEGAPGQQQQQQLCRHQKRRQSPSAVNIQSGRRSVNNDDQNESAFTTPTSTSSNLMAQPDHDNKAAAVMSDNSVAAAAPVDNDSNDRHLLPSQSEAGRTAEASGNSSGSNDVHLLSSTVIFLGSSSSDNDEPWSSNDDVINYPPTKAPSAIVVDKTTAGDADNLVKFKDHNAKSANDCSSNESTMGAPSSSASLTTQHIPKEGVRQEHSRTGNGISTAGSDDESGLSFKLRGTGWGSRRALIGLCGGGELTNGSTGWGPPPAGGPGGANSGWGAPPPPNPSIAAAWGAPVNASNQMSSSSDEPQSGNNATKNPGGPPPPSSPLGVNPQQAPPAIQPPQTSTSWAAAAGKGLPPSENPAQNSSSGSSTNGGSSSSKPFEQLNSVREALFSQDGWGGNNVKQDSAWNIDGMDGHGLKDAMTPWSSSVPRNDGTELWKSTLSGQPPVAKPQPSSPWHTPQNPTDYKQWGEDDDTSGNSGGASGGGSVGAPSSSSNVGAVGARDNLWNAGEQSNNAPYNAPQKPKDDWSSSSGWNSDPRATRDPIGRGPSSDSMNHRPDPATWNPPGPPGAAPRHPTNWNVQQQPQQQPHQQAPVGRPVEWGDSPTMSRRVPLDDGTSLWGNKQPPNPNGPPGVSNWKDMPTPNNMHQVMGRPPGPPGPRMPPVKDPSPWNTRGWSADPADTPPIGWGEGPEQVKRDLGGWGESQWSVNSGARPRLPPNPLAQRGSPGWDEPPQEVVGGWGGGGVNMKPVGQKKMISSESIWNSKQYRVLVDMGCRKEDAEFALRTTAGNLEDAIELLNTNGRMRDQGNMFGGQDSSNLFDQSRRFPVMPGSGGQNPYSQDGGQLGGYKMPNTMPQQPRQPQQQQPQQQPPSSQPSAQQLRILVQQIQMAVQAGHLNPQILNQPLAPQTLISLNQLLQQIKTLQSLQQQHSMAQSQKPMGGNSSSLLAVSVNITKTKQNIQNLQNQISAQQAAYLKSQPMQAAPPHQQLGGSSSFEHGMSDIFGNYGGGNSSGQPTGHSDSHLPVNKSRLNLWKLPEEGSAFSKAPGASSSGPGKPGGNPSGLGFDDNPWTPSGSSSGWPDTNKSSSGLSGGDSVSNGLDSFGIPEFEPGKPWKGPGMKNPDDDPNLTPGSMAPAPLDINALSKATSAVNLQSSSAENSLGLTSSTWSFGGSGSELKPTSSKADAWNQPSLATTASSSNLTPMGQDLWGKSATGRTPPGMGNNDGGSGWPSSNGWNGSNSQNGNQGNDNSMMNGSGGPSWLLLKNLTPQIDGSTLKTLCMQHGPLKHFDIFLNHSIALVMYATGREAQKAQKALNNCLLGNTTIHATSTSDSDAAAILQQLGGGNSGGGGPQLAVTSTPTRGNTPNSSNLTSQSMGGLPSKTSSSSGSDMWGGLGTGGGGSLFSSGTGVWSAPGSDMMDSQQRTTPQLQPFLPGDLLGENM